MSDPQAQRLAQQSTYAFEHGEFLQALAFIDQAISLDPTESDHHIVRGVILAQMKQADQASEAFQTAIRCAPQHSKGYYNLAVHLNSLGRTDEALEMARAALSRDSRHAAAASLIRLLESGPGFQTPSMSPASESFSGSPAAPYGAEGYVPVSTRRAHSIRFVEAMGAAWYVVGGCIAGVSLFTFVKLWQTVSPLIEKYGRDEKAIRAAVEQLAASDPAFVRLALTAMMVLPVVGFVWLLIELFDRQGPWWWMAVYVGLGLVGCLCLSPGWPWLSLPAYIVYRFAKKS